jgi:hypothetical protein
MRPEIVEPCYVVLREDEGGGIAVKLVLWSAEEAEQEILRLNALNRDRGCHYYYVRSRAKRKPV